MIGISMKTWSPSVLALAVFLIAFPAQAGTEIDFVGIPDAPDSDVAAITWPADTFIKIGEGQFLSVQNYQGGVKNGKADGFGRLEFGGLFIEPGAFISPFSDSWGIGFVYIGQFKDGMPNGAGDLYDRASSKKVRAEFSGLLKASGSAEISILGKPTIFMNLKDGEVFPDGPLKIYLYPPEANATPSQVFYGFIKDGKQVGSWSPIPWRITNELGTTFGFDRQTSYDAKDGTHINCTVESFTPTTSGDITALNGTISDVFWNSDPVRSPSRVESCEMIGADKWRYKYKVNYVNQSVEAISCSSPSNVQGEISLNPDSSLLCKTAAVVTSRKKNVFVRVWKEIARTPDNVKHGIVHTITQAGEEFEEFVCSLAGRKPGENCTVNGSVGTTIEIPENIPTRTPEQQAAQSQRESAAKASLERIANSDSTNPQLTWAQAAASAYSLCVTNCNIAGRQDYSLMMIQGIEAEMKAGFDKDINYRRLASSDVLDTFDFIASNIPVGTTVYKIWRGSHQLDKLRLADDIIAKLPPVEFAGKEDRARMKVRNELELIGIRDIIIDKIAPTLIDFWKDTYEELLPEIPILSPAAQFVILHELKMNIEEFAKAHAELKTADAFFDAVIAEKLSSLGAKWPASK